ncbi:MAG: HpcH/HpaI aldolase/citrate lyase family protein [Bacteroidia bacterium]
MPTKSILFVPANKIELLPKAFAKQPDVVLLDLEDAVSLQEKDAAREQVFQYLTHHDLPENLALRINSITTPEGLADILVLQKTKLKLKLMFLAKVESYAELEIYYQHLKSHCEKVIPFIESTKAFSQLTEIAKHPFLAGLTIGGADLCKETGMVSSWENLAFYRNLLVMNTVSNKILAIDSPYFEFKNLEGLKIEAEKCKQMGFSGKLAIHPSQVEILNTAFAPTAAELEKAERIIEAFEAAGGNVCQLEGEMIDYPIYWRALKLRGGK